MFVYPHYLFYYLYIVMFHLHRGVAFSTRSSLLLCINDFYACGYIKHRKQNMVWFTVVVSYEKEIEKLTHLRAE